MDQKNKSFEEIHRQFHEWNSKESRKKRIKTKVINWFMYVMTIGTLLLLLKNIK